MDLGRFKIIEIADQVSDQIWNEVNEWNNFSKEGKADFKMPDTGAK